MCILALEECQTPVTKKLKVMPPVGKAIMSRFQKSSPTINATSYCLVQCMLKDFICRKQPGSWMENYSSLLTMAEPMQHMHSRKQSGNSNGNSLITCPTAQTLPWVIFTSLVHRQNTLVANIFPGNAEVQHETSLWLQQLLIQFYTNGFRTSLKWWDKCISYRGLCEK